MSALAKTTRSTKTPKPMPAPPSKPPCEVRDEAPTDAHQQPVLGRTSHADCGKAAQWHRQGSAQFATVMIADCGFEATTNVVHVGPTGDHADSTGKSVATEQGRLRPLDDFYAFNVEQIAVYLIGTLEIDTVEERRDILNRIRHAGLGLAADHRLGQCADSALEGETWSQPRNFVETASSGLLKLLGSDRRNGERHILHVFRTLLRGHDDVADATAILSHTVLRDGRHGHGGAGAQNGYTKCLHIDLSQMIRFLQTIDACVFIPRNMLRISTLHNKNCIDSVTKKPHNCALRGQIALNDLKC
jgi:hypothetical protein